MPASTVPESYEHLSRHGRTFRNSIEQVRRSLGARCDIFTASLHGTRPSLQLEPVERYMGAINVAVWWHVGVDVSSIGGPALGTVAVWVYCFRQQSDGFGPRCASQLDGDLVAYLCRRLPQLHIWGSYPDLSNLTRLPIFTSTTTYPTYPPLDMPVSLYAPFDDVSPTSVPHRDIPLVDECTNLYMCPPVMIVPAPVEEGRGRSRSRSRSRSPSRSPRRPPSPVRIYSRYSRSPSPRRRSRSRSRSSSRSWRRCRRRSVTPPGYLNTVTYRPGPPRSPSPSYTIQPPIILPQQQLPIVVVPQPSPPLPSSWYKQPVDILTFHYNKNMAYAPAAKTYDEAIDNVVELWPELREVERDRIHLLVTGSDHLVRVPRMTWTAVLCDLPRYEVVHVQVEELPPPPQYQGKGKGKWGDSDGKGRRSSGLFSSIRRIFFG